MCPSCELVEAIVPLSVHETSGVLNIVDINFLKLGFGKALGL
jgi:hypothetical protein